MLADNDSLAAFNTQVVADGHYLLSVLMHLHEQLSVFITFWNFIKYKWIIMIFKTKCVCSGIQESSLKLLYWGKRPGLGAIQNVYLLLMFRMLFASRCFLQNVLERKCYVLWLFPTSCLKDAANYNNTCLMLLSLLFPQSQYCSYDF